MQDNLFVYLSTQEGDLSLSAIVWLLNLWKLNILLYYFSTWGKNNNLWNKYHNK